MQKSFPLFLRQLHLNRKSFKESDILKTLSEDDFEELKNLGLLKRASDLTHVTCESCDDPHAVPVRCEDEKLFVCCESDSMPNYLEESVVRRWELDVSSFLQGMMLKFGMENQVESLDEEGLWLLGSVVKDDTPYTCFFYYGRNMEAVAEFLEEQRAGSECQLVITTSKVFHDGSSDFLTCDVSLLVEFRNGSLQFNKKVFEQYLNSLRLVQFDPQNGNLSVGGEPIAIIPLNTPQFYFADFLWEKFGEPRSNEDIRKHVSQKRRHNYDRESNQVCYDLKSKIKALVKGDDRKQRMIDEIFKTSPTKNNQNGFMMTNPTS